jgi:membrane fusion protein (multidrug efflux system)
VKSPIHGVVGVRQVRIGSLVGQGEPTLLTTVSQLDTVRVRFPVSEQLYLRHAAALNTLVERGPELDSAATGSAPPGRKLRLELILADGSTYPEKGWLSLIDRAISISTGSIILEARFPNPRGVLRPGQFGRVRAATQVIKQALVVPQRSVIERQSLREVMVLTAGNKVERRAITAGVQVGSYWVVDKGLKAGDIVLTEGLQKVKPGVVVEPREVPLGVVSPSPVAPSSASEAPASAAPAPSSSSKVPPAPAPRPASAQPGAE